jgi:hypothetical protein
VIAKRDEYNLRVVGGKLLAGQERFLCSRSTNPQRKFEFDFPISLRLKIFIHFLS